MTEKTIQKTTKIFFDMEFTGLHQHTTPISIGLTSEHPMGINFYGEFTDYDQRQVTDWIQHEVISKLQLNNVNGPFEEEYWDGASNMTVKGTRAYIAKKLLEWLKQFDQIEFWSDCLSYDWVLLSELIADYSTGYPVFPDNVAFYCPFDIVTLAKMKGIDPDFSRIKLSGRQVQAHNAIHDAEIIKECYHKLINL